MKFCSIRPTSLILLTPLFPPPSSLYDRVLEKDGARVVVDEVSLPLMSGSTVDYQVELIGSMFKIVNNPLASSTCGCDVSFEIK